jgi:SHS2 domain-containing protein
MPRSRASADADVFRWVEHTAELGLEIEAPSPEGVFEEALAAFAELAGDGEGPRTTRNIELEAPEQAMLLVDWLNELLYLADAEQFVPERIVSLDLDDGRLRATVEGQFGEPSQLLKAVTLHRLEFRRDETVGWRAHVVLDV